jgi:hypothetical protein
MEQPSKRAQSAPGMRAYSAHNRLHVNAPTLCRFAHSYIIGSLDAALPNAFGLSERWLAAPPVEMKSLVRDIVEQTTVAADRIEIRLSRRRWPRRWRRKERASGPISIPSSCRSRRNAPHPTTRKRPRKTLWPFGRESRAFVVSGWRDRPKANLRKFRGYSSDCQNQEYGTMINGVRVRDCTVELSPTRLDRRAPLIPLKIS